MKITGVSTPSISIAAGAGAVSAAAPSAASSFSSVSAPGAGEALESAVLQPAQQALRALPDFDAARVAELRDALSKGQLPFDAGRLAGLIQRFHGSKA